MRARSGGLDVSDGPVRRQVAARILDRCRFSARRVRFKIAPILFGTIRDLYDRQAFALLPISAAILVNPVSPSPRERTT